MTLTRYQVRNEYGLAEPEVYRAALVGDDPEAILEGVAMAGLVGILRQLGDLAEFAAAIFHDLHEEVVVTAARGHGLMIRLQQLEAEYPSVEKEMLSQTYHSAFFYNEGVDWHSSLQIQSNLIAHGDLPRCIMDSYEECRGPPQFCPLDKFDAAGGGSCLKRYSNPSLFKGQTALLERTRVGKRRERKSHKVKRNVLQLKNDGTRDIAAVVHSKLHPMFLDDHHQTDAKEPPGIVKLKSRELSGFLHEPNSARSYMEKFLECASTQHHSTTPEMSDSLWSSTLCPGTKSETETSETVMTRTAKRPCKDKETEVSVENTQKLDLISALNLPSEQIMDKDIEMMHELNAADGSDSFSSLDKAFGDENSLADEKGYAEHSPDETYSEKSIADEKYSDGYHSLESNVNLEDDDENGDEALFLSVGKHESNKSGEQRDLCIPSHSQPTKSSLFIDDYDISHEKKGSCLSHMSNMNPSDDKSSLCMDAEILENPVQTLEGETQHKSEQPAVDKKCIQFRSADGDEMNTSCSKEVLDSSQCVDINVSLQPMAKLNAQLISSVLCQSEKSPQNANGDSDYLSYSEIEMSLISSSAIVDAHSDVKNDASHSEASSLCPEAKLYDQDSLDFSDSLWEQRLPDSATKEGVIYISANEAPQIEIVEDECAEASSLNPEATLDDQDSHEFSDSLRQQGLPDRATKEEGVIYVSSANEGHKTEIVEDNCPENGLDEGIILPQPLTSPLEESFLTSAGQDTKGYEISYLQSISIVQASSPASAEDPGWSTGVSLLPVGVHDEISNKIEFVPPASELKPPEHEMNVAVEAGSEVSGVSLLSGLRPEGQTQMASMSLTNSTGNIQLLDTLHDVEAVGGDPEHVSPYLKEETKNQQSGLSVANAEQMSPNLNEEENPYQIEEESDYKEGGEVPFQEHEKGHAMNPQILLYHLTNDKSHDGKSLGGGPGHIGPRLNEANNQSAELSGAKAEPISPYFNKEENQNQIADDTGYKEVGEIPYKKNEKEVYFTDPQAPFNHLANDLELDEQSSHEEERFLSNLKVAHSGDDAFLNNPSQEDGETQGTVSSADDLEREEVENNLLEAASSDSAFVACQSVSYNRPCQSILDDDGNVSINEDHIAGGCTPHSTSSEVCHSELETIHTDQSNLSEGTEDALSSNVSLLQEHRASSQQSPDIHAFLAEHQQTNPCPENPKDISEACSAGSSVDQLSLGSLHLSTLEIQIARQAVDLNFGIPSFGIASQGTKASLEDIPLLPPPPPARWLGKLQSSAPLSNAEANDTAVATPFLTTRTHVDEADAYCDFVGSDSRNCTKSVVPIMPNKVDNTISQHESVAQPEVQAEKLSTEPSIMRQTEQLVSSQKLIQNPNNSVFDGSSGRKTSDEVSEESAENVNLSCSVINTVPQHKKVEEQIKPVLHGSGAEEAQSFQLFRSTGHNSWPTQVRKFKVSERKSPPLAPKVDDRDSLLEQIRNKSFNLKPAIVSKPSIHREAPATNLKINAILEKANKIRQAMAGPEEEEDSDGWSDC